MIIQFLFRKHSYLCTRTSGIYSSEDNFRFGGIVDNRYVVIQPGLAWMKVSQFGGISFALKEEVQVYVEGGGDTNRTDLIVLRYDGNQNECSVACKKDSISVDRDNNIFELGLYKVFVEAGSTQIVGLGVDVQDVRLTDLCGIMKDGVTGIPVNNLVEEFRYKVQTVIDELDADGESAISTFNQNANHAIAEANTAFDTVKEEGDAIVRDLIETESDFNNAVDDANAAITQFLTETGPNAISDFGIEGNAAIASFQSDAQNAIEELEEEVANVAAGTNTMLQTAFNPSGQVGQVAFASQLPIVAICCFAKKVEGFGPYPYFCAPFSGIEKKTELLQAINAGREIVFRMFTIRTATEDVATREEFYAARDFINGEGGDFYSVFDLSKPVYDFRLMSATKTSDIGGSLTLFGIIDDELKVTKPPIDNNTAVASYITSLN